jgi:hypothetical protein
MFVDGQKREKEEKEREKRREKGKREKGKKTRVCSKCTKSQSCKNRNTIIV